MGTGDEKAVIVETVLVECVYVLTKFYKVPQKGIYTKLRALLHYKSIMNDERGELIEALTIFAERPSLDIVECILCAKSKKPNISLFTFDKALKNYSKRL